MTPVSDTSNTNTILAIEMSNPSASTEACAVALFSSNKYNISLIGALPIAPGMRSSDSIMVLIESLCSEHDISPNKITQIIVSVGPGGYTALRISSTTAKVLAHALGCSVIAVPTALVAGAAIDPAHRPALIALASKNQQAHCAVAHADGSVETVGVIGATQIGDLIDSFGIRSIVADSHLPSSFAEQAEQLGIEIHPIVLDAKNCLDAAEGIDPISPIELAPIYAREPDAITQWRQRSK